MNKSTATGKRIFDELVKRKLSLSQLAEAAGVPRRTLEPIVRGTTSLDDATAARIEAALARIDASES